MATRGDQAHQLPREPAILMPHGDSNKDRELITHRRLLAPFVDWTSPPKSTGVRLWFASVWATATKSCTAALAHPTSAGRVFGSNGRWDCPGAEYRPEPKVTKLVQGEDPPGSTDGYSVVPPAYSDVFGKVGFGSSIRSSCESVAGF
ncbi:hypothetical protein CABS01_12962 [Colletotrichum abscissum]|uniref:Uncharacterized protein n=1 Tax=Colletotrichum abscissum TaxID=1671311 RepID=A0A9P9X1I1_9PEZI|nr:uncharacterized protein CABS01_12962 [Colletotrichum abscissum]KAI3531304.1 hypothetical protein CABS02_14206 [Colletotrichum abscissum]KAK1487483.1 hypothetical protein CABS01_12962 [Colletotrichum abscissum]